MTRPEVELGFGYGFIAPLTITMGRRVLAAALAFWLRYTVRITAHLGVIRQLSEQMNPADAVSDMSLRLFPAHVEGVIILIGITEDEILRKCPGSTRRDRWRHADSVRRKQLRDLSHLRRQALRIKFLMKNDTPFSFGSATEDKRLVKCMQW